MNHAQIDAGQLGEFISGLFDVMFAFSLALERAGLLDRAEIVDMLRHVQEQVTAQQGPSPRTLIADLMLKAFDVPHVGADARSRLRVIDGGG